MKHGSMNVKLRTFSLYYQ